MADLLSKNSADSLLVSSYISGDEYALELLIKKHEFRLFNFIYSRVSDRDTAEDILQDTFIKVIQTLRNGMYNEEGKCLSWIMRIAHNLVIDFFRKKNRVPKFENKDDFDIFRFIGDGTPNVENVLIKDQLVRDLQRLIQELSEDQKEVLIMRLYCDMSFREIAESTNVSINTALGRMRYAIINLRKLIKQHQVSLTA